MRNLRNLLTIVAVLCSLGKLSAQAGFSEQALYKVTYKFSYAYDTTNLEKKQVANVDLFVGESHSLYRYAGYELFVKEKAALLARLAEWSKVRDASPPFQMTKTTANVPETELFKKIDGNTLYRKEVLIGRDYIVTDSLAHIAWEIEPETKKLGDYNVQKATGVFRGRKYIAWFAPELPMRAGPWKLSGLPGIILEAADEKNEVVFSFTGVEKLQKQETATIVFPSNYFKANESEFQKLKKLSQEDPGAFISNRQAQQGYTVTANGKSMESLSNGVPRKPAAKSAVNNPIEIITKK